MANKGSIEFRKLGNSDMELTRIGFGAWAIGGDGWSHGWGPQDDKQSIAAIHRALELGINWIDTAPSYGLGHSEEVVGRALKATSYKPYVFTKCAVRWREDRTLYESLKAESLTEELDASLRRLGVETIDLYQIHWPKPDEGIEEGWEALSRFQEQGKVRWIGVSNFSVAQMRRAEKIAPITSLQPPYSMLRRAVEAEALPFAQEHGIGVINYAPMTSGLLTGRMTAERAAALPESDWRRNGIEFKEPRLSRNMKLVEMLRGIGQEHGVVTGVVATAWTLYNPTITAAIVGLRNDLQVDEMSAALKFQLSEADYDRILAYLEIVS
ncbi:MAG TPA: aldo/keto reductase [Acidobacteriaceae bacterium]|nr:aldo/keto reductase [Acidobacteriaceae bacterium]